MRTNVVTIKRLPETLTTGQGEALLRELSPSLSVNRPCLVLDCSSLHRMDTPALHLLLCCLEEAIKRNGDVRLAGVSSEARAILTSTGADRLFRIFDLSIDAERSFDRGRHDVPLHAEALCAPNEVRR